MKYNIFDYNQKKAIELGLDLKDLLILNWIQTFYPKMNKTIRNGKQYFWVKYSAVLSDIPILEIESEKGLYKRMQKMCEIGILEYLPIRTAGGCFAYYLITELMSELVSSHSSESSSGSSESSSGSSESSSGSSESSDAIIYSSTINNPTINNPTINKDKNTATAFSPSLENPTTKKSSAVQKQQDSELKTKQEVQEFVRNFKAKEVIIDGILQTAPIFSENEIDLITEYIMRRKEAYKSKVKNTQKALTGVLNDILQAMKEIPIEIIFEQLDGVYVNCGTAGDKTKPFQTIKIDYFKHLKQKPTFNNQNANTNTVREYLKNNEQRIRSFNPLDNLDTL